MITTLSRKARRCDKCPRKIKKGDIYFRDAKAEIGLCSVCRRKMVRTMIRALAAV